LDHAIWHNILLYTEHTYGSHRTRGQPEHDEVVGQLKDKEDQTVSAEWDIDRLMRTGMSQLAYLVKTEGENLIVFNPLSWRRSGLVRFMLGRSTTLTDVTTDTPVNYDVVAEKDGAQAIRFWAADVPPVGYKVYRMGRGQTQKASPAEQTLGNIVENRFYKITLDPSRAAIEGIYDKELRRELVDASSPYRVNEYLLVAGGGTETGRGTGEENTRLLIQWFWLPPAELTIYHAEQGSLASVETTAWGKKIRMTASALRTPRIETEILLPDDVKRIELRNVVQVNLPYAKQAAYFAFPWALSSPTFRYDIANGFVNPAKDLLEGGCAEWFSVQQVVNTEDGTASVDLAIVDSPLVCLGEIYRGRWPRQFTSSSSTVFSYILNNYWSPKYGGKKSVELVNRYAITSGTQFEPTQTARFGREMRFPMEVAELKTSDKLPGIRGSLPPAQASFVTVSPESLLVSALKAAEEGEGLIVRVQETAGQACEGLLNLPFAGVSSAREASAVEVPGRPLANDKNGVRFQILPNQVLTIRLKTHR